MVLGVSANSRTIGLAVISDKGLIHYATKLYKSQWGLPKLQVMLDAVTRYAQDHAVSRIVTLRHPPHYVSDETNILLETIDYLCIKLSIPQSKYEAQDVYKELGIGRNKKQHILEAMTELYPQLLLAKQKEERNKIPYYQKMFEAVAVATVHFNQSALQ